MYLPNSIVISIIVLNIAAIFLFSMGFYVNSKSVRKRKAALDIDNALVRMELENLKQQFHAPLTFDFFNFCSATIRSFSPETAKSVEGFSSMLNYSLTASAKSKVKLKEEIDYIENCIALHYCLTSKLNITFRYQGNMENTSVLQGIFIVFIENSLKHGILHDPSRPVAVIIEVVENDIFFAISNAKNNQKAISTSGVGLQNVKQLLHLYYPDGHQLVINDSDRKFECQLRIQTDKWNPHTTF